MLITAWAVIQVVTPPAAYLTKVLRASGHADTRIA